jgi:hypothetical protein
VGAKGGSSRWAGCRGMKWEAGGKYAARLATRGQSPPCSSFPNSSVDLTSPSPCTHIYGHMKTTLDLPEEVLTQAKVYAALHRTTLKELVTEGLRRVISPSESQVEAAQRNRSTRLIAALKDLGHTGSVVPLRREEIYDRQELR